jgi:O-antigen ligase
LTLLIAVLMGVGVVLAVGMAVQKLKAKGQGLKSRGQNSAGGERRTLNAEHRTSNIEHQTLNWGLWLRRVFFLAAAGVMGVGLVRSYSRGAWVGAAAGLGLLVVQGSRLKGEHRTLNIEHPTSNGNKEETGVPRAGTEGGAAGWAALGLRRWLRSRLALGVVVVSLGVLAFWGFRQAERAVARRAYSAANVNDFSWRKRLAAYEGALQMVADKPCFGFGWNQPEQVYDRYYRAAKVDESMAIQLNDYLILGTTLGVPALLCFGAYVGLGLTRRPSSVLCDAPGTIDYGPLTADHWLRTTCRAGAIVLLVGFWFDGGLFKLATGAIFWVLLELGREKSEPARVEDGGLRMEVTDSR